MKKYILIISLMAFMSSCSKKYCPGTEKSPKPKSYSSKTYTSKAPKTARYKSRTSGRGLLKR